MTGWLAAVAAGCAVAIWRGRSPAHRLLGRGAARSSSAPSRAGAGAVALAGLGLVFAGLPVPAVGLLAVAGVGGRRLWRRHRAGQERERCATAVIEITFALAAELRAGRTPAEALAAAAPVAGPLSVSLQAARAAVLAGASAATELGRAAAVPGAERIRYVAAAWQVTETAGGRIAQVLERLGDAMDGDDQLRRELDAALAGPRATVVLLAALPGFGVGLGQLMGARPVEVLTHRPVGWGLLGIAAGLDALGVWVIRRLTAAAARC